MGAIAGGILLDVIEFPRGAVAGSVPADTVWYLGFLEGPATSVLSICGVLLYLRYSIDRKRHTEIRMELLPDVLSTGEDHPAGEPIGHRNDRLCSGPDDPGRWEAVQEEDGLDRQHRQRERIIHQRTEGQASG